MPAPRTARATASSAAADRAETGRDWITSGLLLLLIGLSASGLNRVLTDIGWWLVLMAVATIVLLAGAIVRTFATRKKLWATVATVAAAFATITLFFSPDTALLGIIPTPDSFGALHDLELQGSASIAEQGLPAEADRGIVYLLCLGVAAFAVVMDALAFAARVPALAGIPPLVLLIVPGIVDPGFDDALYFVITALGYLALLLVRTSSRAPGAGMAAAAVVGALIVPLALPPVVQPAPTGGGGSNVATGINPILNLGEDLRQGDPTLALTYTSTAETGLYMRLTALDDFSGTAWEPTSIAVIQDNEVAAIGAAPGLGEAVPRTAVTTSVNVANIVSRWLPAPYAPTSIAGLDGQWSWEPDALAIRSEAANARNQQYVVESVSIAPSVDQLLAAGTIVDAGFERYLQIPEDLPEVVAERAAEVTGGMATNYEKAIALQDYFRGGDFVYSEEAPVESGYDGSGARVLDAFLAAQAGYCVHFSSAMASMARTLGIPARVAVGFTPGQAITIDGGEDAEDTVEYRVTTHNLHAWPELYFSGIGWVRFEPTPGRGSPPAFAPLAQDDPATPDVDESVPTPTEPTAPSTAPTAAPDDPANPTPTPTALAAPVGPAEIPWWWGLLAALAGLIAAPAVIRSVQRTRRLRLVEEGSSSAAWDEVRDTADDLGLAASDGRTPRQRADDLAPHLDPKGQQALERLRVALEAQAYAAQAGRPLGRDVRAVLWSLRRRAGVRRTLTAAIAPRSLFAAWLPAPSSVDPAA